MPLSQEVGAVLEQLLDERERDLTSLLTDGRLVTDLVKVGIQALSLKVLCVGAEVVLRITC